MNKPVVSIEPAIDPNNRISFLLDWELTMKCNLDCGYCDTGLYGGHDNSSRHPNIDDCERSIDFMFRYADLYLARKKKGLKYCILNVYGGEALHHPNIVPILQAVHSKYGDYENRWHLTITTTTNLIISDSKLSGILPLVDEFTCSFHTEITARQKQTFLKNLLKIKQAKKRLKVIIMMNTEPALWKEAVDMCDWCERNGIKYLPKRIDYPGDKYLYDQKQVIWLDKMYQDRSFNLKERYTEVQPADQALNLTDKGRACCGGRTMCVNQDRSSRVFYVPNKFQGWFCSVNEFFVFVKQRTGEIFVNKDCKMNFDGSVGPIGHIDEYAKLLELTEARIQNDASLPIQCAKTFCLCGLCAPKAKSLAQLRDITAKYQA